MRSHLHKTILRFTYSALCLTLAMVLPFLTGQIPSIGQALAPMHLPVFLCGFTCGWPYGLLVGFIAPFLRSVTFGMPPLFPSAVGMAFELATYGFLSGLLYRALPKKFPYLYLSLIGAMIGGRSVWGGVRYAIAGFSGTSFTFPMFLSGALLGAIPGIIIQIILIPVLIFALDHAHLLPDGASDLPKRQNKDAELAAILGEHAARYPLAGPRDVIKLLYQNEFGGDHLVTDAHDCIERLRDENAFVAEDAQAIPVEPIGNGLCRVHLAASAVKRLPAEELAAAFMVSAAVSQGTDASFLRKLDYLEANGERLGFSFTQDELKNDLARYRERGIKPVSHSDIFREAYRPHYRVIAEKYLPKSLRATSDEIDRA